MRYKPAAGTCMVLALCTFAAPASAAFHFSDPTTYKVDGQLWSVGIGDFDGDGRGDIAAVTDASAQNPSNNRALYIYFGKQGGGFAAPVQAKGLFPDGDQPPLIAVDLNADGRTEIFIGHAEGVTVVHVDGARHLTSAQAEGPYSVMLSHGDVNGDGLQDVVSDTVVYYGTVQGGLATALPLGLAGVSNPRAITVEDMNRDGRDDLVVADRFDGYVFLSKAGGLSPNPQIIPSGYEPWDLGGIAAADFNHDGRIDISFGKASNSPTIISLFYQSTVGTYATRKNLASYDIPGRMIARDIDRDGLVDLLVMHDAWENFGIYFQSDKGLSKEVLYPSATSDLQTGTALGDLDGDGCTDIVVANPFSGLQVRLGQGCATVDIAATAGLTENTATVRIENKSKAGVIDQAMVEADLSIRVGSMQLTTIPGNCAMEKVSNAKTHVECLMDPIAAGQSETLSFGFQASPPSIGNRITVTAVAKSPVKETNPDNNSATKWINFWPVLAKQRHEGDGYSEKPVPGQSRYTSASVAQPSPLPRWNTASVGSTSPAAKLPCAARRA